MNTDVLYENNSRNYKSMHSVRSLYFIILCVYVYGNFVFELIPPLLQVVSIIRALSDVILLFAGFKYLFRKENSFLKIISLLLIIISSINFYLNSASTSLVAHLNGLREPIVLIISLAILTSIFHSPERTIFIRQMNKFLMIFLTVQVPIAVYQFLRYGAGDQVGGTFSDGGSGMISQVIFMGVYYFYIVRSSQPPSSGFGTAKKILLFCLLLPIFINETKISFIYLAILVILNMKIKFNIGKIIYSVVTGTVILFIFVKILAFTTKIDLTEYLDMDNLQTYYFSDWTGAEDITRFGKLILTINNFDDDVSKHLFGIGYGLMKGKFVAGESQAGREYERLYYGSRMMIFTTYIQGGIALSALFLVLNFYYFGRPKNRHNPAGYMKYKLFLLSLYGLMWIYNEALLVTYFNVIAVYFLVFLKHGDFSEGYPTITGVSPEPVRDSSQLQPSII